MLKPVPHDDYSHIINNNKCQTLAYFVIDCMVSSDMKVVKYLKVRLLQPSRGGVRERTPAFSQLRMHTGSTPTSSLSINCSVCMYADMHLFVCLPADGLRNLFQGMRYFKDFSRNKKE